MAIDMTTSMASIEEILRKKAENFHRATVRRLCILGEECVTLARDRGPEISWYDQTGNLRSSIGFVVVYNGQIVEQSGFTQVKNGSEGPKEGIDLAREIARQYISGYALIVVAGMEYAVHVEALDNKDVLTSAELYAKHRAPIIMRQLEAKLTKA